MARRNKKVGQIIIPANVYPWPHELRVAQILARAGFVVEFLLDTKNIKTADVLVNGIPFEIKSPFTNKPDKLERVIKRALKQSCNIVFDTSRIKNMSDARLHQFLAFKAKHQPQINRLLLITKAGKIVDIK